MKSIFKIFLLLIFILPFISSCDTFKDSEVHVYEESLKNLDGSWQLKTVIRNNIDITHMMDFSQFRLNLNSDGKYTIENYLPFAVKQNGEWAIDDPKYPFNLSLKEAGATEAVVIKINYPIVAGKRIIEMSLSPGCYQNIYEYVFEKVELN